MSKLYQYKPYATKGRPPQYKFMRLEGHPAKPSDPVLILDNPYWKRHWVCGKAEIRGARDFLNRCLEILGERPE